MKRGFTVLQPRYLGSIITKPRMLLLPAAAPRIAHHDGLRARRTLCEADNPHDVIDFDPRAR